MTEYRNIYLTDLHFGYKHSSVTWLNDQLDFLDNEVYYRCIRASNENKKVNLFILGDLFDNRKTVDINVACKVKERLNKLATVSNIYIICGNHDLYDNNEEFAGLNIYNALGLTRSIYDINIFDDTTWDYSYSLLLDNKRYYFAPWFTTVDKESLTKTINHVIENANNKNMRKIVLCHMTLPNCGVDSPVDEEIITLLKENNILLISGHIHTPNMQPNINCYNLGSCYPLTFQDANQKRGYYIENDDGELEFIENTISRKFYRFYGKDELFSLDEKSRKRDFIELYLPSKYFEDTETVERLKEICAGNSNITIYNIPDEIENIIESAPDKQFDMHKYIDEYIPEHLKEKYIKIKSDVCKENKNNEL